MSQNDDNSYCINNDVKQIRFNLNKAVQVYKILAHISRQIIKDDVVFTMVDENGQRQSFLSPISGIIKKLNIHEYEILSYDSIIFEYEECGHCGMDMKQLKNVSSTSNSSKCIIPMKSSFSHMTIAREEASRYDSEERNHLLRKRKLHLLVDLDQTLVHTKNIKNHYPSSPDVITYRLNTPVSQIFYTKLRPGVKEFFRNLRSLYQFHIVTFGDRPYANTIAKLIDPTGIFFSNRILSRDECLSLTDKTANLNSLFRSGDSLVCIIDDREDVWNNAPNLIPVNPYTWFKEKHQRGEKRKLEEESDEFSTEKNSDGIVDTDRYLCQLEIILKNIHKVFYNTYDQWNQNKNGIMPNLKQIMPDIRRQTLKSVSLCFSHLMPQNYPMEKHRATIIAKAMGAKVTRDLQFDSNGIIQTTHLIATKQTMKVHQALQNNIKVVTPEWLMDCYEQWEKKSEETYILTPEYDLRKSRLFTEEIPRASKEYPANSYQQTTRKRKHSQTGDIPLEDLFDEYNFDITVNPHCHLEKEVNNLCNNSRPRPSKRQRTVTTTEIVNESASDNDDSDLDSLGISKFDALVLDKKDGYTSDEESLDDDDVPRGWKKILTRQRHRS